MFSKILQNYLRFWARQYLKRVKPQIITVTGSAGKTSTKDAIFEVLKAGFGQNVRKSEGNLNTIYGVALAVLGFKKPPVPLDKPSSFWPWIPVIFTAPFKIWSNSKTKYLVLEIAADKPGDIKFTTSYVSPNIVVLTNIGPAHLEIFGSIEKIIEEKTGLIKALKDDGWAIINNDDENLKSIEENNFKIKNFALNSQAQITAKNIVTDIENFQGLTNFQVISGPNKFLATSFTLGRVTNIYSALAAVAVGEILGLKKDVIISGIKNIKPEKHRMEIFVGKSGSIIIDDTYNANPLSMKAALDTLKILPSPSSGGKKIAVIGDMLELGKKTDDAHKLIGAYAQEVAEEVVAVGSHAKLFLAPNYFPVKKEAIDYLLSKVSQNDIILIKASRGMQFEEIVKALRADNYEIQNSTKIQK